MQKVLEAACLCHSSAAADQGRGCRKGDFPRGFSSGAFPLVGAYPLLLLSRLRDVLLALNWSALWPPRRALMGCLGQGSRSWDSWFLFAGVTV